MIKFDDNDQNLRVDALHKQEEERLIEMLSKKYDLPYIKIVPQMVNIEAVSLIPEKVARESFIASYDIPSKNQIALAVFSPNNPKTQKVIDSLNQKGLSTTVSMASRDSLNIVWERYKEISLAKKSEVGVLDVTSDDISVLMEGVSNINELTTKITELLNSKSTNRLSRIFEFILSGAFVIKSSDIHMEPQENGVRVRYRIDGVLQDVINIDHEIYKRISTRVKLLSGLKLNVQRDTQDGRFSIRFKNTDIEIRTSVLPGQHGESIVLRILDPESISVSLEGLGINNQLLTILKKEITKPTGMILTTGPTGAGKTTTLYAFLKKVLNPDIKIITIEDPVEYHINNIVQTQVNRSTNYTFLSGLRAALRQDPDIIMIGEIRDGETAKIAVNASLTGHLVLSTLHTNSAAGTIPRLIDLGINPKVLATAMSVSMAQRLVRKLCNDCKVASTPKAGELTILKHIVKKINIKHPDSQVTVPQTIYNAREGGCEKCNGVGYIGRIGVYEAILMDETIEELLDKNPSEKEIVTAAIPQGIFNMQEDGIMKVIEGTTSLHELGRVLDIEIDT
ncbi:MAG: type II/IV secretion system protein [Candidatus Pacebacteria bacterium]|nr:type II/IV secretion system protein [Candidatus Paceibacterota bacterium]